MNTLESSNIATRGNRENIDIIDPESIPENLLQIAPPTKERRLF